MARACTVCAQPEVEAIDEALVGGASYRSVAARWRVSRDAVRRHANVHLPIDLAAIRAAEKADADVSTLARVHGLYARADRILARAEADGKATLGLAALKELRMTCELLARLSGELRDSPALVVNVASSAEWIAIRSVMFAALAPHPEARAAVARELLQLEAGS